MARGKIKISSSSSAFYKETLSLWPHAASEPSLPCFFLAPLYAETWSDKLTCVQEGCWCPQGKFHLWSAVCLLCPSDPLCNQTVCLQTACLLCLRLLVHEVHLVTICILFNNKLYPVALCSACSLPLNGRSPVRKPLRLKLLCVARVFSPFSLYLKEFPTSSCFHPQAGALFLPVYNFPMLFSCVLDRNRLYSLFTAVAGAQITSSWS